MPETHDEAYGQIMLHICIPDTYTHIYLNVSIIVMVEITGVRKMMVSSIINKFYRLEHAI